jgi:Tfp pilus assembly protein PilF
MKKAIVLLFSVAAAFAVISACASGSNTHEAGTPSLPDVTDPNETADTKIERAHGYIIEGEYDRAIRLLTEALELLPNSSEAYWARGNAWIGKEEPDKAIADFSEAIRIFPYLAVQYNSRGRAYLIKRDYTRARADWEQALLLDPDNADAQKGINFLKMMEMRIPNVRLEGR